MTAKKKSAPVDSAPATEADASQPVHDATPEPPVETSATVEATAEATAEGDTPTETPTEAGPSAAQMEPPAPPAPEQPAHQPPTMLDAAADRLREATAQEFTITDESGHAPDPEQMFSTRADGALVSNARLYQHGTATKHDRSVTTLLIARGAVISPQAAAVMRDAITAQRARSEG